MPDKTGTGFGTTGMTTVNVMEAVFPDGGLATTMVSVDGSIKRLSGSRIVACVPVGSTVTPTGSGFIDGALTCAVVFELKPVPVTTTGSGWPAGAVPATMDVGE